MSMLCFGSSSYQGTPFLRIASAALVMSTAVASAAGQVVAPLATQLPPPISTPAPRRSASAPYADSAAAAPFRLGESATYDVKFGIIHVGSANAAVVGVDDVRGRPAWHTTFRVQGGTLFYHVNDLFESWIDQETFSSLRFYQTQHEGSHNREKRYEIYPEQESYVVLDKHPPRTLPGVRDPLDDGSFLFFVRTIPLVVGRIYEWNRYFQPERNPVRVRVLRMETVQVPAGTFHCVVVQPMIKTPGILSEDGHALVWLTDDPRHVLVQLKAHLRFGSINLYLRSYRPGG